ncbi:MAG: hypothetical protein BEN19_03680 [Epulopiscium sp. Nuni2H_MBin003]|nr:MAG: hypothetical protein BEN19_03680 [Epulopiscium sp. Nuni2H_MBin003]
MKKGILFDKDGTLLSFQQTWAPIINEVANTVHNNYNIKEDSNTLLKEIGVNGQTIDGRGIFATKTMKEIAEVWQPYVKTISTTQLHDELSHIFYKSVEECKNDIKLIDGAEEVLRDLHSKGYILGVATADRKDVTVLMLETLGIKDLFSYVGADDGITLPKPNPYMLNEFCAQNNLEPANVFMVGDTLSDMQFGKNAGAKTIAILDSLTADDFKPYTNLIINTVAYVQDVLD